MKVCSLAIGAQKLESDPNSYYQNTKSIVPSMQ
jgi:hypothetical protein